MRYLLIILVFFLTTCGNPTVPTRALHDPPSGHGEIEILNVKSGTATINYADGKTEKVSSIGSILVRNPQNADLSISAIISEKTKLFRQVNKQYSPIKFTELTQGDTVVVFCIGAISVSLSRSCIAEEIILQ